MKRYGLIGYPLGHSFSAGYFAEKFSREHIDATYENFPMSSLDGLRSMIAHSADICGLNVTIPHKQKVMALLDELSEDAQAIGAVNVIAVRRRKSASGTEVRLKGYNSDVIGFADSLSPLLRPCHRKALVLGTGGASCAVIAALRKMDMEILCVSRRHQASYCGAPVITYSDVNADVLASHLLIVNCTPLGMSPKTDQAADIPYGSITARHLAYDLVYNPAETLFLKKAAAQGATVKNGLEMLHRQAEASWRFWNAD